MTEVLDKEKSKQHVLPAKECFFNSVKSQDLTLAHVNANHKYQNAAQNGTDAYLVTHIPLRTTAENTVEQVRNQEF